MKISRFLVLSFVIATIILCPTIASATERKMITDQNATAQIQKMDMRDQQVSKLWAQMPELKQAQAIIEVTNSGRNVSAYFGTTTPINQGSFVIFRMTLPNGLTVPLQGYTVTNEGFWAVELWNGTFPWVWPSGLTQLEAILVDGQDSSLSYVSAYASVNDCCSLQGPIRNINVGEKEDGLDITFTGNFAIDDLVVATVDGQSLPVSFFYSGETGLLTGKIHTVNYGQKEMILTVCSRGVCYSRHIYAN